MTSQIKSHVEYLIAIVNITVLLCHFNLTKNVITLEVFKGLVQVIDDSTGAHFTIYTDQYDVICYRLRMFGDLFPLIFTKLFQIFDCFLMQLHILFARMQLT